MVHLSSKPFLGLILYLTPGKQMPLQKIKEQVFSLFFPTWPTSLAHGWQKYVGPTLAK